MMRMAAFCALMLLMVVGPSLAAAQELSTGGAAHKSVGNGTRYVFHDSQGRQWTYAAHSGGGYRVFDENGRLAAYVTATYE